MKHEPIGEALRTTGATVTIERVSKNYGPVQVLDDVSVEIAAGEFLTLLGPSGSGKTTLLQMLAGFVRPSGGSVRIDGEEILLQPPHKRDIGVVFQNYALFPHMSVADNVAYPLRTRGTDKSEIRTRVKEALETVQLGHLGDRPIAKLSGGQRQRVALARAIIFRPRILLMDEPLSALDKKLREQMQIELRQLHRKLGMTTVLVTHDQREALSLSDRIGIINHGKLVQLDEPGAIYEHPSSRFVADFIGDSSFVPLTRSPDGTLLLQGAPLNSDHASPPGQPLLVVRPEKLRMLGPSDSADNVIEASVRDMAFQGDSLLVLAAIGEENEISARLAPGSPLAQGLAAGHRIRLGVDRRDAILVNDD